MKYRIGCSGFYYPAWKNMFYPEGLAPRNWLSFYSSVFNSIELNSTFYRQPRLSSLKDYASITPHDFTFSVKMSRYITHINRLNDKQLIIDFQKLIVEGIGDKLGCFLFQLPPSFQYTNGNLKRIIKNIPHSSHNVVELRHTSWWNTKVEEAFRDADITFCNVDFPGLDSYFVSTSKEFYLRLHGSPELFVSSYSLADLELFASQSPPDSERYSIYFNNTTRESGYTNALQLMDVFADFGE